jgi:opacity protein-like surface antigen
MRAVLAIALLAAAAAPAHAQWAATVYVDNNVAGDVQSGRLGAGVSAGYYLRGRLGAGLDLGLELDGELHGHFFRDEDVADLVPAGVDLNTRAALGSADLVVPYCLRGAAGTWCPYATAGLGVIHAMFEAISREPGPSSLGRTQTDLALNAGVGVTHALTRWIGLRVDARYFHAFVDENATSNGYPRDYGYWRVSVGVVFGGPPSARP